MLTCQQDVAWFTEQNELPIISNLKNLMVYQISAKLKKILLMSYQLKWKLVCIKIRGPCNCLTNLTVTDDDQTMLAVKP